MPGEPPSFIEQNLKEPFLLLTAELRSPFWAAGDLLKRHVYFVRHLAICDRAKKELVRRRILKIGYHMVKEAFIRYEAPLYWNEPLRVRIFLLGLLRKNR